MSDVTLKQNAVGIEGQLQIEGSDIHLDFAERRSAENGAAYRRAMVHNNEDHLVVNFADDYLGVDINGARAGGISLNGRTEIGGQLLVNSTDIHLNSQRRRDPDNDAPYRRALVHGSDDELIVNFSSDYNGVTINARDNSAIKLNGTTFVDDVNILDVLRFLLAERRRLYGALNALERRAGGAITIADPPEGLTIPSDIEIPGIFTAEL